MNNPWARQSRFNVESFDQWAGFSGHRERVSDLLAVGSGRLCVLGAGNANDLALPRLLEVHREVHLVDLDAEALARGAERQGVLDRPTLVRHGNLDLTGMLDAMKAWSPLGPVAGLEIEALVDWPGRRVGLALPGPFDLVASTCLLSQLIANAHHAIGEAHPQFASVVRAIRLGHLRLLAQLVRPGGRVVLVTDLTSTDWVPDLADRPESALGGLMAEGQGLIHGVNPNDLLGLFRSDPVLGSNLDRAEVLPPWRWRLHSRVYLVTAITARAALGPFPRTGRLPDAAGGFILRT